MITTPTLHTNIRNGQPPLDNTRPFLDDTGCLPNCSSRSSRPRVVVRVSDAICVGARRLDAPVRSTVRPTSNLPAAWYWHGARHRARRRTAQAVRVDRAHRRLHTVARSAAARHLRDRGLYWLRACGHPVVCRPIGRPRWSSRTTTCSAIPVQGSRRFPTFQTVPASCPGRGRAASSPALPAAPARLRVPKCPARRPAARAGARSPARTPPTAARSALNG